jgi:hypothetical protein
MSEETDKQTAPDRPVAAAASGSPALTALSDDELREQTDQQYKAVAHMARSLAEVHEQTRFVMPHQPRGVLELQCRRSAEIMEILGDALNAMDAVDEEQDGWITPIFERAHQIFQPENDQTLVTQPARKEP